MLYAIAKVYNTSKGLYGYRILDDASGQVKDYSKDIIAEAILNNKASVENIEIKGGLPFIIHEKYSMYTELINGKV